MPEIKSLILDNISETLLIPLYYRAIETQRPDAMIKDEKAVELIKRLSSEGPHRYDSDWLKQTPMSEVSKILRIMLTREMDRYALDFLTRHPEAVVVHIGKQFISAGRNFQVLPKALDGIELRTVLRQEHRH